MLRSRSAIAASVFMLTVSLLPSARNGSILMETQTSSPTAPIRPRLAYPELKVDGKSLTAAGSTLLSIDFVLDSGATLFIFALAHTNTTKTLAFDGFTDLIDCFTYIALIIECSTWLLSTELR